MAVPTPNATRVRLIRRVLAVCAAGAVLATGLPACSSGSDSGTGSDTGSGVQTTGAQGGSGVAKKGGDVTAYVGQQILGFDPPQANVPQFSADGGPYVAVYGLLFYVDSKTNKVTPNLGKSLKPNAGTDCKVWTMGLRPGVKFSDGTPLDAAAVAYNYKRILDQNQVSQLKVYVKGVTFDVKSAENLQITLPKSNCAFDKIVANYLTFIGSPTAMKKEGKNYYAKPVGAGPFLLKDWQRSAGRATFVRNPTFWKKGQPYLDKLTIAYASNKTSALDAMISGQAQLSGPLDDTAYDEAVEHGLGAWKQAMNGGFGMQFNTARPPFNKLCARLAFAYGLDPEAMVKATNPSKRLNGAATTVFQPDSPFYDANVKFPSNDVAKAKAEAKKCAAQGNPVKFVITVISGFNQSKGAYISSRLNTIPGIDVKLRVVAASQLTELLGVRHDFDVAFWPGGMKFGDPVPAFGAWLRTHGSINLTGYSSAAMDAALDQGANAETDAARKKAYETVQKLWTRDIPFWLYGKAYDYFIFDKDLVGLTPVNPGNTQLLLAELGYKK